MKKNDLTLKQTFLLAVENYKKRNFPLSEKLCYKILSIDSDHFDSLVLLSNIHAIGRNFVKAKELLNKANEIKPNNLTVLNNLGTAYKELGDNKESIKFYEKVLKINSNHANANYNLGIAFHLSKELEKAKNFFKKTVEVQPNYAMAYVNLANIYAELKQYEYALSNYKKAIEINSKLVSAHNNIGLVFRILNDYPNAINSYEQAIKLKNDHAGAHHNLALALKETGKFKEAIKSHEMSIKYEPENLSYHFYLSELKKNILDSKLKNKIIKILEKNESSNNNIAYGNYLLSKYEKDNHEKELEYLIKGHKYFFESRKERFELGVKYCFEDVIQIAAGVTLEKFDDKTDSEISPIFIVGVPRCGSTLVEKIIGSGKNYIPMGEETAVLENFVNSKILEKQSLTLGDANLVRKEINGI